MVGNTMETTTTTIITITTNIIKTASGAMPLHSAQQCIITRKHVDTAVTKL
jgi:hypothetical protein